MFSRTIEVHLCAAILRPALTYECEVQTLTGEIETKAILFENEILRFIYDPNYIVINQARKKEK